MLLLSYVGWTNANYLFVFLFKINRVLTKHHLSTHIVLKQVSITRASFGTRMRTPYANLKQYKCI